VALGIYAVGVIFITAKFRVLPAHADRWPEITREFTQATRAEPGNLWFDWSRSLDDPTEYVLVEAFRDGDAGVAHVQSDHFKAAIAALPAYLLETPRIVSQMVDQADWSELGEMKVG
jgi:quinol monooxygenase YgiN